MKERSKARWNDGERGRGKTRKQEWNGDDETINAHKLLVVHNCDVI